MTTTTTRGWHFTTGPYGPNLKMGDIPIAKDPAPHEIIVRVKAAAINPVDVQIMNLPFWSYVPSFIAPAIKGTAKDFSGVVEKAGSDTTWKKGDELSVKRKVHELLGPFEEDDGRLKWFRLVAKVPNIGESVFGLYMGITVGTMQELAVIDTNASAIVPKPSDWSWDVKISEKSNHGDLFSPTGALLTQSRTQAAALPLVYLTARTTIESVAPFVTSTKKVVVLGGSSSTGMYAVHLAKARGWHVVASCSGRNADFVRSMGADEIIDYTNPSAGGSAALPAGSTLRERVAKYKPEAIIDCVGGTETIGLAKRYVTIVGDKTGRMDLGGTAIYLTHPTMVLRHFLGYLGVVQSYACVNLEPTNQRLEETLRLPKEKIVIDSIFKFEDARAAFEKLNTGRARGKVVVEVGA